MTKLGLSSGWWSSMLIVSPLRVMGPLASTVGDDWVTAGFRPVEVPGSAHYANRDRLYGYAVSGHGCPDYPVISRLITSATTLIRSTRLTPCSTALPRSAPRRCRASRPGFNRAE
jgi:hypothetical protein